MYRNNVSNNVEISLSSVVMGVLQRSKSSLIWAASPATTSSSNSKKAACTFSRHSKPPSRWMVYDSVSYKSKMRKIYCEHVSNTKTQGSLYLPTVSTCISKIPLDAQAANTRWGNLFRAQVAVVAPYPDPQRMIGDDTVLYSRRMNVMKVAKS